MGRLPSNPVSNIQSLCRSWRRDVPLAICGPHSGVLTPKSHSGKLWMWKSLVVGYPYNCTKHRLGNKKRKTSVLSRRHVSVNFRPAEVVFNANFAIVVPPEAP